MNMEHTFDIQALIALAEKAGEAILKIYAKDFEVETKADASPLTEADLASNAVIVAGLKQLYPDVPIISEENKLLPYDERKGWDYFWLVDPLDGTKEFIKKNGEFTVNIALIKGHTPVLGVVHIPVQGLTFYGDNVNGTYKKNGNGTPEKLHVGATPYTEKNKVTIVASRSHNTPETEDFISNLRNQGKEVDTISSGSSLKFCLVAEGKADVYPRFGPTMEWDTAAAHAIAKFAGLEVYDHTTGKPLQYNKENLLNPWFVVK